jgi:hypothetical protein
MRRALSFVAIVFVSLVAGLAQAETYNLQHGPRTPASAGTLDFNPGKEGNNRLSVKAKYLAMPKDLGPNVTDYVVWLEPGQGRAPTPIGVLKPDKNREANLDVNTPYKAFNILVTAESSATPSRPSNLVILRGSVQPKQNENQ